MAGFLGPSCNFEQMDHDQLLLSAYTRPQLEQQLSALGQRFGQLGAQTVGMIRAYVRGVNTYISQARVDPGKMPADYVAVPAGPQPWSDVDVVAITSLITTQATGGGSEVRNAALLRYLQEQLGSQAGGAAFGSFKEQNDPTAPSTITDRRFPYMIPGRINRSLTAIPDHPSAPLVGGPTDTTAGCRGAQSTPAGGTSTTTSLGYAPPSVASFSRSISDAVAASLSATVRSKGAQSNAVLVDSRHSADGHPIAVFGPELGYYAPEVLMVEDLHAPGYDAEGAAFPGTNLVVQLGRGRSYAWSATTASTDQIDQRMELICAPHGGGVPAKGAFYRFRGKCLPMDHHVFSETVPGASGGSAGSSMNTHIFSTIRGFVREGTTVSGKPVAVVDQRSTFMHDVDSLVGFL